MLQNALAIIEKILRTQIQGEENNIKELLLFFEHYRSGTWIYPGVIKRKFDLSISKVYDILESMEYEGILKRFYELYCGKCQRSNGTVHTFKELPEEFECEMCFENLNGIENALIVYKVL